METYNFSVLPDRLMWAKQAKETRDNSKLPWVVIARVAKVSTAAVSIWKNGGNGMTGESARPLAAFLGVNPVWLETGEGRPTEALIDDEFGMTGGHKRVLALDEYDATHLEIRKVKLKLSAGITGFQTDEEADDGRPISFKRSWFDQNGYVPEKLIAIVVKGESMEPTMSPGDTVVVNTADTAPVDGKAYAVNYEGEAVVKRLVRDAGMWWLNSDNPDQRKYSRKRCADAGCIIIGRIVMLQRENI